MAQLIERLRGHRRIIEQLEQARKTDRLGSALIFSGPSGIGKKLVAQILAQDLLCERPQDLSACGTCGPCRRVEKNQSESILRLEPDGASIKIEQARDVLQFLALRMLGRARLVVIDQAHLLGPQAANALLKSIEEPPPGSYFILLTPVAGMLLSTIRSRAQLVRFQPLTDNELVDILGETDEWILRAAGGSVEMAERLRDASGDFQELEDAVSGFLKSSAERFPSAETGVLKERLREREGQVYAAYLLQDLLRDGLRVRGGVKATGILWPKLGSVVERFSSSALDEFAEFSLNFAGEMARNIDRSLLLENFALRWRKAVEG